MRTGVLGVIALGLLTAACGTNQEQRAATGGLTGLGVGALVGGPVGAAVGLVAGAAGGTLMPEDATSIANNMLGREHRAASDVLNGNRTASASATVGSGSSTAPDAAQAPQGLVKEAQTKLKQQGYYNGAVDGIEGPQTRQALRSFQQHEGLRQTARLDRATSDRLQIEANAAPSATSGSSAPDSGDVNAPAGAAAPDNTSAPGNYDAPLTPSSHAGTPQNAAPDSRQQ